MILVFKNSWIAKWFQARPPRPSKCPIASRDEATLLSYLAPCGLDWKTPLSELATRHGAPRDHDANREIALPAITTLTREPLQFFVQYSEIDKDLPPCYAHANFMPHDDARKNHEEIKGELSALFGPGKSVLSSNALQEDWQFGRILLSIISWPPELQRPLGVFAPDASNPRLRFRTFVSIRSEGTFILPCAEICSLFDEVDTELLSIDGSAKNFFSPSQLKDIYPKTSGHVRYSRVHPSQLVEKFKGGQWCIWRNPRRKLIGVSEGESSVVFDLARAESLHLCRLRPNRWPGGSDIQILEKPEFRHQNAAAGPRVIVGDRFETLDDLAKRLSEFWSLPLLVSDGIDD